MTTALHQNSPCPMMKEPGLQRCVEQLERRIQTNGGEPIPTISSEMLACYEQRARELRSEFWISGLRRASRRLGGWIPHRRYATGAARPVATAPDGQGSPCAG